jgi:mannan endo-1,4-beta-mannosidase
MMTRSSNRFLMVAMLVLLCSSVVPLNPFLHATDVEAAASMYWGAYIKGNTYGYDDAPWDERTINTFESNAGKKVAILHWGQPWYWSARGGYQTFQDDMAEKVRLRGSIPMITWTSEDLSAGNSSTQSNFTLSKIINGQHDSYIRQWARDAKAWGHPMFIRFDHEMNGYWYNWSESANGNSSGQFVTMWRHVVDIFKQEGANNVTWVWAPNRVWEKSLPLRRLYPGDSYVDWVGMSAYNWGTNPAKPNNAWQNFDEVFKQTYDELGALAPTKPIMITEIASSEYGGSKSAWITEALKTMLPTKYPRFKAVLWFNWNCPSTNGNMDWVIESSSSAKTAFAGGIASSYYASNSFASLPLLNKVKSLSPVSTAVNVVENASFETTNNVSWYNPWTIKNALNATFSQDGGTSAAGKKSLKVNLPSASSSQPWSVQLRQPNKVLVNGKTYVITFYAKASTSRSITMLLQDTTSPHREYNKRTQTISTAWTKYTFTYTSTVNDSDASLVFNLAQASGQVWLDNVSVVQQ